MQDPSNRRTANGILELLFERVLFSSRWLLAPLYAGLVAVLLLILAVFASELVASLRELWHGFHGPSPEGLSESKVVVTALSLVDLVLLANLVLMVMLTGYENVISRLDIGLGERPVWLRKLDATGLKLRLFGSIAAISGIQVLREFMDLSVKSAKSAEHAAPPSTLQWMLVTHGVFVVTGLIIAVTERIGHALPAPGDGDRAGGSGH